MFIRQVWTLLKKDLLILAYHRWFSTLIRALIFPIVFTVILSEIKTWTATSGLYGVGSPSPIMPFPKALSQTSKEKLIIIDNGYKDGDIGQVVRKLSSQGRDNGKQVHILPHDNYLQNICPSSSKGVSNCYGAVQFYASPDHGPGNNWNYTLYADGSIGNAAIYVNRNHNDLQLYSLAFQRAIDSAIATTHGGRPLPSNIQQYPFTYATEIEKEETDNSAFQDNVMNFIAFAFFVGLSGAAYHCVGFITYQREQGILRLIDAMMPNFRRWQCIVARNLATHIAFDIIYLPGWIVMGAILPSIIFPKTNVGYLVVLYLLTGLALNSYAILASSLFRKAQLSAISAIIAALVFAIVAQFAEGVNEYATYPGVIATALLFPPSTFVYFLIVTASFEGYDQPLRISGFAPTVPWQVSCTTLLGFLVFQILLYPVIGTIIEHYLHGTSSKGRRTHGWKGQSNEVVKLQNFCKEFKSRGDKKQTVKAVNDLTLSLHPGSITVLLGANGSGKSTTLNAIAGLESISKGSIDIDSTGGLGLCPQKNVMWDEMTVEEHVDFFTKLKRSISQSRQDHKKEVSHVVSGCDLDIKKLARSSTLSGGQKRKLQLAMMLAGG